MHGFDGEEHGADCGHSGRISNLRRGAVNAGGRTCGHGLHRREHRAGERRHHQPLTVAEHDHGEREQERGRRIDRERDQRKRREARDLKRATFDQDPGAAMARPCAAMARGHDESERERNEGYAGRERRDFQPSLHEQRHDQIEREIGEEEKERRGKSAHERRIRQQRKIDQRQAASARDGSFEPQEGSNDGDAGSHRQVHRHRLERGGEARFPTQRRPGFVGGHLFGLARVAKAVHSHVD